MSGETLERIVPDSPVLTIVKNTSYREMTLPAAVLGLLLGLLMNASFTYAGLVIGFSIPGSMIAAMVGWGVLRGVLRRGTFLENNINQTIASGITMTSAGMIFTVPVLYLMEVSHSTAGIVLAAIAGVLLGVVVIVPFRTRMIDIDRLPFPSGTAVATIIRSPASGTRKSILLLAGFLAGGGTYLTTQLEVFGAENIIPQFFDPGRVLGLPPYVSTTVAVSMFALAAGYLTGRTGLIVLAGGMLAYWVVPPVLMKAAWLPEGLDPRSVPGWLRNEVNMHIGVGMLTGGAVTGAVLALPSLGIAFSRIFRRADGSSHDDVSLRFLIYCFLAAFAILFAVTGSTAELSWSHALLVTLAGIFWIVASGLIIAESTGLTNFSPISGMALVSVTLILLLSGGSVLVAITIGTATCVAASQCADIMHDLKTGHLVGSRPRSQVTAQLLFSWIGPIASILVIILLWKAFGFDEGSYITAPQARAIRGAVESILGGDIPVARYGSGIVLGTVLSFTGLKSLGVLAGLAMILPFAFIIPYGAGCLLNVLTRRILGDRWTEEQGVPLFAGILLGDSVVTLIIALFLVLSTGLG